MNQISALIESMCSFRENDLRLIKGKQVERVTRICRRWCWARAVPIAPRDAPMIAAGFRPRAVAIGPRRPIDRDRQDSRDEVVILGRYDQNGIGAANALLQFQHG